MHRTPEPSCLLLSTTGVDGAETPSHGLCLYPVNKPDPICRHFGYSQLWLLWPACSLNWAGLYLPYLIQFPFSKEGRDPIVHQPAPDVDGLVRVWPNRSGLEASQCARLIRPVSGQHFQADPDPMRIRSGMFTGYILCLCEGGKRVVMAVALAWCDGGLAVYVALVDSCQPGVHFRVSLPETHAGFPEVLSLTLNWHSIMFVVCLFFSVSSLQLFCLLQLWLTQLYFVGKGGIILLLFFSCRQCSQSLLTGSHT